MADQSTSTAAPSGAIVVASNGAKPVTSRGRAFTFGDPEAILDRRDLLRYAECWHNGRWYEPPMPRRAFAKLYDMSPHHRSAILYKRNQLLRHFEPSRWLDRKNFGEFALNFLQMGDGYLQRHDNMLGRPLVLKNSPALFTRRGVEEGVYWWCPGNKTETPFDAGSICHILEPDLSQELYGRPEWTSAMESGLLNFDSTIFRRKYYKNGTHAGYILYISEPTLQDADADELEEAIEGAKGPGNFNNLFLHLPGGKEKGVQVIPVGEATAKDEFLNIKNTTRDDILASHRMPPVLIGVVPQAAGGLGKPAEAADVFHRGEIEPLMMRMLEVNDWLGEEAIVFRPYQPQAGGAPASSGAA